MSTAPDAGLFCSLLLVETDTRAGLQTGQHVLGRSPTFPPPDWFVHLDSPRAAVSRSHATIVVCSNGDAWLKDNGSTNGTFLAIRPGPGIRLEPNYFYQLSHGAQILVGDVETRLELALPPQPSEASLLGKPQPQMCPPEPSLAPLPTVRSLHMDTGALGDPSVEASVPTESLQKPSVEAPLAMPSVSVPSAEMKESSLMLGEALLKEGAPVKGDLSVELPKSTASKDSKAAPKAPAKKGRRNEKTTRDPDPVSDEPHCKRSREDERTLANTGETARVCFTGVDTSTRNKLTKLVVAVGGTVEDEWDEECNVLGVKTSPTARTPKLLIAVCRGADVVGPEYFKRGASVAKSCPAVLLESGTIDAASLRAAILRYRREGSPLQGRRFLLTVEQKGVKSQVTQIINQCGGIVARKPLQTDVVISDNHLDKFFTGLLDGTGVTVESSVERT